MPQGPLRVLLVQKGVNGGLSMTRSIGDRIGKAVGVTWKPGILLEI